MAIGLYETLRFLGRPLRYRVTGLEAFTGGPAVFVANHLGSTGPVRLVFSTSIRFYPWVIADMMDAETAPAYLLDDFVGPELGLQGRSGQVVSWILGMIAVRLLTATRCIPVDRQNPWSGAEFRHSLEVLLTGSVLLVFPEDPQADRDPDSGLRPFQHGFIGLGYMLENAGGGKLPFFPAAVIPERRLIRIGAPLTLRAGRYDRGEVRQFCRVLEREVTRLFLR